MLYKESFEVEKILGRRKINGKIKYKVKWEGYSMDECTWEPIKNLENVKDLIDEYDQLHPFYKNKKNKKDKHLLNIKRQYNKDKKVNDKVTEDKIIDSKITYMVDNSLKKVSIIKKKSNQFLALVEKENENGIIIQSFIPTSDLRKINPWILLDFYESKINFE